MIRHRHGTEFWLFTQDDHARLSGRLAERAGNAHFAVPVPLRHVVDGVALHDSGWPIHDRQPTLNGQGLPLHVFETPPVIGVQVWSESARIASAADPYSGLLVSLHVLALSVLTQSHYGGRDKRQQHAMELFALNKFQQRQIELQEDLRRRLGLRTDLPLEVGLARRGVSAAEDLLLFNYHLLKALDRISLAVLCSGEPFATIENVYPRPGADPVDMKVGYTSEWTVAVGPWPFGVEGLEIEVPVRRVPGRPFESVQQFQETYAAAKEEAQLVRIVPRR